MARLTNLASDINHSNPLYIVNIFRKYAQSDWELISNDELHNDGIYIFDKNGRTEIVCLSNLDLFRPIKLKKGSQTILQNIIYNCHLICRSISAGNLKNNKDGLL